MQIQFIKFINNLRYQDYFISYSLFLNNDSLFKKFGFTIFSALMTNDMKFFKILLNSNEWNASIQYQEELLLQYN